MCVSAGDLGGVVAAAGPRWPFTPDREGAMLRTAGVEEGGKLGGEPQFGQVLTRYAKVSCRTSRASIRRAWKRGRR